MREADNAPGKHEEAELRGPFAGPYGHFAGPPDCARRPLAMASLVHRISGWIGRQALVVAWMRTLTKRGRGS
jgi:hypothetical protein